MGGSAYPHWGQPLPKHAPTCRPGSTTAYRRASTRKAWPEMRRPVRARSILDKAAAAVSRHLFQGARLRPPWESTLISGGLRPPSPFAHFIPLVTGRVRQGLSPSSSATKPPARAPTATLSPSPDSLSHAVVNHEAPCRRRRRGVWRPVAAASQPGALSWGHARARARERESCAESEPCRVGAAGAGARASTSLRRLRVA